MTVPSLKWRLQDDGGVFSAAFQCGGVWLQAAGRLPKELSTCRVSHSALPRVSPNNYSVPKERQEYCLVQVSHKSDSQEHSKMPSKSGIPRASRKSVIQRVLTVDKSVIPRLSLPESHAKHVFRRHSKSLQDSHPESVMPRVSCHVYPCPEFLRRVSLQGFHTESLILKSAMLYQDCLAGVSLGHPEIPRVCFTRVSHQELPTKNILRRLSRQSVIPRVPPQERFTTLTVLQRVSFKKSFSQGGVLPRESLQVCASYKSEQTYGHSGSCAASCWYDKMSLLNPICTACHV